MTQDRGIIYPERFFNLEDVKQKATFTVLLPSVLPSQMDFKGALYFTLPHLEQTAQGLDWVQLFYERPGQRLVIHQGNVISIPRPLKATPADAHGVVTIQGMTGVWRDGKERATDRGWERAILHVGWEPNPLIVTRNGNLELIEETRPGFPKSCILLGLTSEVDVDLLVQVGNSLS